MGQGTGEGGGASETAMPMTDSESSDINSSSDEQHGLARNSERSSWLEICLTGSPSQCDILRNTFCFQMERRERDYRERDRVREREREREGRRSRSRERSGWRERSDRRDGDEWRDRVERREVKRERSSERYREQSTDRYRGGRDYGRDYDRRERSRDRESRGNDREQSTELPLLKSIPLHPLLAGESSISLRPPASSAANLKATKPLFIKREKDAVDEFLAVKPVIPIAFNDPRLSKRGTERRRRELKFGQKGKFISKAQQLRAEEEMEALRREVVESLGRVGVETDIVADLLLAETVPDMDWWDLPFLESNMEVDALIQRPALIPPPGDVNVPLKPLMLTEKERKKMRRQRRLQANQEKQDKIKLGLIAPDPPKVRLANISRLIGDSVQEPSSVEARIRKEAAERHLKHLEANAERKKQSSVQPKAKAVEESCMRAVFKVLRLDQNKWKYKIAVNARELHLSGIAVYSNSFSLIVVEGSLKEINKYKRLVLERIKWGQIPDSEESIENRAVLVWEGPAKERTFQAFITKDCFSDLDAKEFLSGFGMDNYWQLAKDL